MYVDNQMIDHILKKINDTQLLSSPYDHIIIDDFIPNDVDEKEEAHIVHAGNFTKINWPKVVLWSEPGGLKTTKGYTPYFEKRDIKMFVNHWDVCLNSKTCAKVLNKRGISVHFCIEPYALEK